MTTSSTYSMLNVAATLDGMTIQGFFDGDDVVSIEPVEDTGQLLVGADGSSIFSQTANNAHSITLRLQHTSPTHKQLQQKAARQRAGSIVPFAFNVKDTTSGEGGTGASCFVMREPNKQNGTNATVREWQLVCPDWRNN